MAAEEGDNPQLSVVDSALLLIVLVLTSVEKGVLFPRVTMEVAVQENFPLLVDVPDDILRVKNRRMKEPIGLEPLAVEINT